MKIDKFGQFIFSEDDLCEELLKNPNIKLNRVLTDAQIHNYDVLGIDNFPNLISYKENSVSISEFDACNQAEWFMPESYKDFDIAKYVLEQCKNDAELQRAGHELLLFQERDMFDLLRYLKYIVDVMRENKIVWGVGRGSSVSSFVLYIIGVHKINSLYYDLDIQEFLK